MKFKKAFLAACSASLLLSYVEISMAENVKIPVGNQTPEARQLARPSTGMTKTQVKSQFGEPQKANPAKGNPPISNWEYSEFTVYFENDHVIHSVIKPKFHEDTEIILKTTEEVIEQQ